MNYIDSNNVLPDNMRNVIKKIIEQNRLCIFTGSIALTYAGLLCRRINDIDVIVNDDNWPIYRLLGYVIDSAYPPDTGGEYIHTIMNIDGVKVCFFRYIGDDHTILEKYDAKLLLTKNNHPFIWRAINVSTDEIGIIEEKKKIGTKKHLDDIDFINWRIKKRSQ